MMEELIDQIHRISYFKRKNSQKSRGSSFFHNITIIEVYYMFSLILTRHPHAENLLDIPD